MTRKRRASDLRQVSSGFELEEQDPAPGRRPRTWRGLSIPRNPCMLAEHRFYGGMERTLRIGPHSDTIAGALLVVVVTEIL